MSENNKTIIETMMKELDSKNDLQELIFDINGQSFTIKIKSVISFKDMSSFVNTVVNNSFTDDEYDSVNNEMAFNRCLLAYYTNIPFDIEDIDNLIYQTNIMDLIKDNVSKKQLSSIKRMILESIDFKQRKILSVQKSKIDELINRIAEEQSEIISEVNKFVETFNDTFSNVNFDVDKMMEIVDKLNSIDLNKVSKELYEVRK